MQGEEERGKKKRRRDTKQKSKIKEKRCRRKQWKGGGKKHLKSQKRFRKCEKKNVSLLERNEGSKRGKNINDGGT